MPTVKTIKDVDEEDWLEFKSMAARNRIKMGKLFGRMVEEYKKSKNFWDEILRGPAILSKEEADSMLHTVKKIRKEYGFRLK